MSDDISQIAAKLTKAHIGALDYHSAPGRKRSCGNMNAELQLLFDGLLDFGDAGRLVLTPRGLAVRDYLKETKDGNR